MQGPKFRNANYHLLPTKRFLDRYPLTPMQHDEPVRRDVFAEMDTYTCSRNGGFFQGNSSHGPRPADTTLPRLVLERDLRISKVVSLRLRPTCNLHPETWILHDRLRNQFFTFNTLANQAPCHVGFLCCIHNLLHSAFKNRYWSRNQVVMCLVIKRLRPRSAK